jgi:hypothetical protein
MNVNVFAGEFNTITFSSGEGVLTSGLTISGTYTNNKTNYYIVLNEDLIEGGAFRKITDYLSVGITPGKLGESPYIGPRSDWTLGNMFVINWVGWCLGTPEKIKIETPRFCFNYHEIGVNIKNISISGTLLHFMENKPQWIINGFYSFSILEEEGVIAKLGYQHDLTLENPMINFGVTKMF